VLDFDKDENLVAVEFINASDVLSKLVSEVISLTNIKSFQADIIRFRNMNAINIKVKLESGVERIPILFSSIKKRIPVLEF